MKRDDRNRRGVDGRDIAWINSLSCLKNCNMGIGETNAYIALCLGAGGCRICKKYAWPEPCRFPEKAVSGMEGYSLFVTQVCRNVGVPYYYGEKTITDSACILY